MQLLNDLRREGIFAVAGSLGRYRVAIPSNFSVSLLD